MGKVNKDMKFVFDIDKKKYDKFVKNHSKSHFLQSYIWGSFAKKEKGLMPHYVGLEDKKGNLLCVSLLLEKKLPLGYSYFYAPRGFVIDYENKELLKEFTLQIRKYAKDKKAIFIKIDPDIQLQSLNMSGEKVDGTDNFWLVDYLKYLGFKHLGFNKRFEHSQPRYTFRLDLTQGIDSIYKNLHSTTKKVINKGNLYNLEIFKNDVKYIDDFYETMLETSKREGIVPYSKSYYSNFYEMLHKDNNSDIYIVYADIEKIQNEQQEKVNNLSIECDNLTSENKKQELKNQINKIEKIINELDEVKEKKLPLASIITTKYGNKVWTMHGGNHTYLRNLNANYLIYYEIIKDAVKEGYEKIDFFGTAFNPTPDDPEYGIFLFKSRLGGEYTEFIGEFDLVTNKTMYVLFTKLVPFYRKAVRKIKKIKNK